MNTMIQTLLSWKRNDANHNHCKLCQQSCNIQVSLRLSMKIQNDVLVIKPVKQGACNPDHAMDVIRILLSDIVCLIAGVHSLNSDVFNKRGIKDSHCLSIVSEQQHVTHLQFNNTSQRDIWCRNLHQHVIRSGKQWTGSRQCESDTASAAVLQYSYDRDERKEPHKKDMAQAVDIDDILLTPPRLKQLGMLLHGTYFRTYSNSVAKNILSMFSTTGVIKDMFQDQIFVSVAKQYHNSSHFSYLTWTKSQSAASSNDTPPQQCIYVGDISSIAVKTIHNPDDEHIQHYSFMKIKFDPSKHKLAPLILYHANLDFLWNFAKSLMRVCDTKGITNQQHNKFVKLSQQIQHETLSIFCGTYNVAAAETSCFESLDPWLRPMAHQDMKPDVYAITLQEIVPLNSSQLVMDHGCECEWEVAIYQILSRDYVKIESIVRGGLVLFLFAKKSLFFTVINVASGALNVGKLGAPNKGAVAIRADIGHHSMCFIGAHLPSGAENHETRNDAYWRVYNQLTFDVGGHRRHIRHHDVVFWSGDLNYRLNVDKSQLSAVHELIGSKRVSTLLYYDQLSIAKRAGQSFIGFHEMSIAFLPTYKYKIGSNRYQTRKDKKQRIPSFTDRVLYRVNCTNVALNAVAYDSVPELLSSDHKPVYALFELRTTEEVDTEQPQQIEASESEAETFPPLEPSEGKENFDDAQVSGQEQLNNDLNHTDRSEYDEELEIAEMPLIPLFSKLKADVFFEPF